MVVTMVTINGMIHKRGGVGGGAGGATSMRNLQKWDDLENLKKSINLWVSSQFSIFDDDEAMMQF